MSKYMSSEKILEELGEVATNAAKEALEEGAETVVQEAKNRCPVYTGKDKRVEKGALKRSIHKVKRRKGASFRVKADARGYNEFPYGAIVEFSPKINKPFLYPAFEAKKESIKEGIIKAVQNAVRRKSK